MVDPTPLPWEYVASTEHHGPYIISSVGGTIADLYTMTHPSEWSTASGGRSKPISFYHEMADPNAAFIVKAVNNYDALVAALEEIEDLGANGATAARLGNIAHAALIAIGIPVGGAQGD